MINFITYKTHLGFMLIRSEVLERNNTKSSPFSRIELAEGMEQLRWMRMGIFKIKVANLQRGQSRFQLIWHLKILKVKFL